MGDDDDDDGDDVADADAQQFYSLGFGGKTGAYSRIHAGMPL